jgi:formylglycine-generating enzyme required for sulfatase activity
MVGYPGSITESRMMQLPDRPGQLPAGARAVAAGLLGLAVAAAAAWLALGAGPLAVGALALAFVAGLAALHRRIELVADGWPRPVPLPPPEPLWDAEVDDGDEPDADAGDRRKPSAPEPLLDLVPVPAATFWMGSDPATDSGSYDDERPRHQVRLSAFQMARTPVTRGQWRRVMADAAEPWRRPVPERWTSGDDRLPATYVSWFDALAFCNALSVAEGLRPCYAERDGSWACDWRADGYRLPTEAEWERACRAGSETPWFWGDDEAAAGRFAWYAKNAKGQLQPVGTRQANELGLQDMAGNCWEWCWDWFGDYAKGAFDNPHGPDEGRQRVLRGGSFFVEPRVLRSADRLRVEPELRVVAIGFRCVRSGAPA